MPNPPCSHTHDERIAGSKPFGCDCERLPSKAQALVGPPSRVAPDAFADAPQSHDNADGVIMEDESGWSCVDNGNRVCGPGNPQGVPAGLYDEGGVLIDPWPVVPID